jgi:hypothetical protein
MTFALLGPLSSGSPGGPGRFFSWLFVIAGSYVLIRTWTLYAKRRQAQTTIPVINPVGITIVSLFFIAVGFWGVLR